MADTDKELALRWLSMHDGRTYRDCGVTAGTCRFIKAVISDDRDARIAALTKERDEARGQLVAQRIVRGAISPAPHPGDEELRNVSQCLRETLHGQGSGDYLGDYLDTMQQLVLLLAKRALGES